MFAAYLARALLPTVEANVRSWLAGAAALAVEVAAEVSRTAAGRRRRTAAGIPEGYWARRR
jgi:hypothetical protein